MSELPKHLQENDYRRHVLQKVANWQAAFYGYPVYLCGSGLREDNPDPRDWDLRLCLPDKEFGIRYGGKRPHDRIAERWEAEGATGCFTEIRWRWSDDCSHKSLNMMEHAGFNIDFQVYPESYWNAHYPDTPRVRLDTRDNPDAPTVSLSGDPE